MQPRSQFSLGHSAHEPTSSVRRAQPLISGRVTQESIQLRRSAHSASRSSAAQNDELDYSAQAMQPRSQFISGHSAHEPTSSIGRAQPLNSGRVTQKSIQLRRSAHSTSAPGALQLKMTSSTTLHKPCSPGVSSAQAIQLMSPPAQLEELSHPT